MATCPFLDQLTFGTLIAPVSEREFRASYWEQKPMIVHRRDPDYYGDLFTVQDFDDAIDRSPAYVKMNDANKGATTVKPATVKGMEAVLADMRDGGSLILEQLQRHDPRLGLLCRILGQELSHTFETNLYLTPPYGKSSVPHWDNTDVFILQLLGSKRWRIEKDRRIFPIRPFKMRDLGDDDRELGSECIDFTVAKGDLIYIPRGFMHVAECGSEASLHISLGLVPVVLEELLNAIVRAALQSDESLRAALPLGFMHGNGQHVVDSAVAALRGAADEAFVAAVFDQFRDALVQEHPLDISGQVTEFFQPSALTINDIVGPRRGTNRRTHVTAEFVRLTVGSRSIVFPGFFREALEFALNTPAFAIRALPGDLDDEERLVFIERLMQEGLVVRVRN